MLIRFLLFTLLLFFICPTYCAENQHDRLFDVPIVKRAEYYNRLSDINMEVCLDKAESYANNALKHSFNKKDRAEAYYNLAEIGFFRNSLDTAKVYYLKAAKLFEDVLYISRIADCYINIGIIYEIGGNINNSFDYYDKALDNYKRINHQRGIAMALNNIGILHNKLGNYQKGFEYFQEALSIEESSGNYDEVAYLLNNIGLLNRKMGQIDKAIEYYEESIKLKEELGDISGMATTFINLGKAFEELDKYHQARNKYELALEKYLEINNVEGISTAQNNIGSVYYEEENYKEALKFYYKALENRKSINNRTGVASSLNNIARSYLKLNQYGKAKRAVAEAVEIAIDIGIKEQIAELYLTYSEIYYFLGNYKDALDYYKLAKTEQEYLLNLDNLREINRLQTIYETEKKENQIKLQQADILKKEAVINRERTQKNAVFAVGLLFLIIAIMIYWMYRYKTKTNIILEQQKLKLEELVATKNKFFSILSHDLRNPFGMLVSVSGMLNENYSELENTQKRSMVKTINKSAVMTNDLLEDLLKWATIQRGNMDFNPEILDLKKAINEVSEIYTPEASNKNINFKIISENSVFVKADRNMIETVIRNLISNAIKFTNEQGDVKISLLSDDNKAIVKISDSGIGIENEYLDKLFNLDTNHKKIGNSQNKGTGLGLILCKEFLDINNGSIFVESELGEGSTFIFSLPLHKT